MIPGIKDIPLFFIVGRERSGTTLLQVLLDNHPNVVIPTESPFIRHLYGRYAHRCQWNERDILGFYHDLLDEPYLSLWRLDKEKLKDDLLSLHEPCFASLCKTVYLNSLSARGKHNVELIGDKNPQYSLYIPQLLRAFPLAKFIFITRDPRDQVMSMMKVNFERKMVASLAYRWKHFNKEIDAHRKKHPQQFCFVKYEDLVQYPDQQLKNICSFLNITFSEEMLDSRSRAEFYVNSRSLVKEHHQSLLKPIDAGMVYQWKQRMSEADVMMVDAVAGKLAEQLGYQRKYASANLSATFKKFPGVLYGRLYFTFLSAMHSLPYPLRKLLFKRVIMKNFRFWKENELQGNASSSKQA